MGVALIGWWASRRIPRTTVHSPDLEIRWNLVRETFRTIGHARRQRSVFLSILGISWFWLLGAAYQTQLPNFHKTVLMGDEGVVTLLLTLFSIVVGIGSLRSERLSDKKVELGLVPLGSIGLSVFGMDLFWACRLPQSQELFSLARFLAVSGSWRVMMDVVMIGVLGGLNIVPLFQTRTQPKERARVTTANNIVNASFMVLASLAGAVFIDLAGVSIPFFFLLLALANTSVGLRV